MSELLLGVDIGSSSSKACSPDRMAKPSLPPCARTTSPRPAPGRPSKILTR